MKKEHTLTDRFYPLYSKILIIGENHTTTVYFSETSQRKEFTVKILELFKAPLEKAKKILIKPNIVSAEPYPTTTNPEVLDAILSQLSDREILVGDAPAVDAGRSKKIFEMTPLKEVCDNHGVRLVNFYSEKMKSLRSSRGYKIRVSTLPFLCDFVISLPVLKFHKMLDLSGALKNQFGYLSRRDRLLMHCKIKNIDKGIAEVNAAVPASLFIVDAVETMVKAQECRHGGCSAKLGVMIAGVDPVSLDCFGFDLLQKVEPKLRGKTRESIEYMNYAIDYGVGSKNFETYRI
jgi:uncharacterized protein (DUF362 family)